MNRLGDFSVLVVDDCHVPRMIHGSLLKQLGVKVCVAENGQVAVNLHNNGASFNLILMDKEMPVLDGPQATRELRRMGVETTIIGVTGCTTETELKDFMDAGLNDCVCKPLTHDKICRFLPPLDGAPGGSHSADADDN